MDDDKRETFKKNIAQYDYVRFTFCDLNGQSRCKLVPAPVAAEYMDKGVEDINGECRGITFDTPSLAKVKAIWPSH